MSPEKIIAIIGAVIIALTIIVIIIKFGLRRVPLKPKKKKFQKQWRELQKYCKEQETWPAALNEADKLLDKALIKRGFKGKTMGERLVSAQRKFSDNDAVWYGHKLNRKASEDPELKLKESEVKDALMGIRQGLKDLGAL